MSASDHRRPDNSAGLNKAKHSRLQESARPGLTETLYRIGAKNLSMIRTLVFAYHTTKTTEVPTLPDLVMKLTLLPRSPYYNFKANFNVSAEKDRPKIGLAIKRAEVFVRCEVVGRDIRRLARQNVVDIAQAVITGCSSAKVGLK